MKFTLFNTAGFFSNFNRILSWLDVHEQNNNYIFSVQYNEGNYNDKVVNTNGPNIWEELFEQPLTTTKYSVCHYYFPSQTLHNYPYKNVIPKMKNSYYYMNVSIYFENDFPKLIEYYNYLFKKYIRPKFEIDASMFAGKMNVLGVYVRTPLHFCNLKFETYIDLVMDEIDTAQNNYDYIYVSTILGDIYENICKKYPTKVLKNDNITRNTTLNDDWNKQIDSISLKQVYQETFTDAYLLGKCDFVIGGSSNYFMGALIMHNNCNFKIFDCLKNSNGW